MDVVKEDMDLVGVAEEDAEDQNKGETIIIKKTTLS